VDPIKGGGISPRVYLHNAAVFLVCVDADELFSCVATFEVGEGGTTAFAPPPPPPPPPPFMVTSAFEADISHVSKWGSPFQGDVFNAKRKNVK
jgi:hypothetical protein